MLLFDALPPLVPPPRFAIVEAGVYRSAYPSLRSFTFLRSLEIKTVLSLVPDEPTLDLKEFCRAHRIAMRTINVEKYKGGGDVTLLPTDASAALEVILNSAMHPVLMHCLDGRHVVGSVVLLLRRLLQWSSAAAAAEYCSFSMEEVVDPAVLSFVQDFTCPVQLSHDVPPWLWGGTLVDREGRPYRHPQMRLRHPSAVTAPASTSLRAMTPENSTNGSDAALLLPKKRADTEVLEVSAELRLLGCADAVIQAAAQAGLTVTLAAPIADGRRRLNDSSSRRSRSSDR